MKNEQSIENKSGHSSTNINNIINVNAPQPQRRTGSKKVPKTSWLNKAIIGGVIALIVSLAGFYIKSSLSKGSNMRVSPNSTMIEGVKQN